MPRVLRPSVPVVVPASPVDVRPPAPAGPAAPTSGPAPVRDTYEGAERAGRVELSQGRMLSRGELDALRRAGKAELADTVDKVQRNYGHLLAKGAKVVVTTSPGNGDKPVVAIVPPALAGNTDPAMKYRVQVHYHGMGSTAADPAASSPLKRRIEDSFDQRPPTVFVLPHSATTNRDVPVWNNVKDTARTAADAVQGVIGTRDGLTVSAHSLGRRAVESAIRNGGLKADRLDIQDAFYRTQPEGPQAVREWMKQNPDAKVRVLLTSGNMSDEATIKRQADFPPGTIAVDQPQRGHWDAELKPW